MSLRYAHHHDPPSLHVGANHRREVRALTRCALDFADHISSLYVQC